MQTRPFHVCLLCSFCSSVRDFAFSFLQIPPHGGHPCCLANGSHYQAHSRLSPPSYCPCRANIIRADLLSLLLLFFYHYSQSLLHLTGLDKHNLNLQKCIPFHCHIPTQHPRYQSLQRYGFQLEHWLRCK